MKKDFTEDLKNFADERMNRGTRSEKLDSLNEKAINYQRKLSTMLGLLENGETTNALLSDYEDTYSQIIGEHINRAYLQGMRDAYSLMEMLKGGSKND